MRNKVAEKFLIPTLNEKAATSTISQVCGSYIHKQKDTEKIIVTDGKNKKILYICFCFQTNVADVKMY